MLQQDRSIIESAKNAERLGISMITFSFGVIVSVLSRNNIIILYLSIFLLIVGSFILAYDKLGKYIIKEKLRKMLRV
jgi:hypothetical protein